jgi:hypothetical protein
MRSKVAVAVVAGAIGWLFASAGVASANEDEDMLIRRAIQLRKQGNDRAALEDLKHAYGITQSPRAAAQLGFAEQALGLWTQAEEHVREALGAPEDKWIRQNQATLEEALATIRAHLGRVLVEGGQPGAQVSVNGQPVGSLPLADAVSVAAGPVDIEVRAAGYAPALKTIKVAPGEYARVPFTLQPVARPGSQAGTSPPPFSPKRATPPARYAPVPAPPSTSPAPAAVIPLSSPPPETPPELSQTHEDRGRNRRIAEISLIAGGVAAIGGGVAASVIANDKFDAIGADAAADRPYNASNGNWKGYETAAAALYVIGGAAIVGGVVLYATGRPSAEESRPAAASSVSLRPVMTPGRAGANVSVWV